MTNHFLKWAHFLFNKSIFRYNFMCFYLVVIHNNSTFGKKYRMGDIIS